MRSEPRINALILGVCLTAVFFALTTYKAQEMYNGYPVSGVGIDHATYWHATNGTYEAWARTQWWGTKDYQWTSGWVYKDALKPVFYIVTMAWLPLPVASRLWIGAMVLVYAVILVKLLQVDYGWTVALLTLRPFLLALEAGNVAPLLALAGTTPAGIVLATLVKPYLAGLMVCVAVARRLATKDCPPAYKPGCGNLHSNGVDHTASAPLWEVALDVALSRVCGAPGPVGKMELKKKG